MMKALVACEFSGTLREALEARGVDAWSCDLLPSEKPGKHIQDCAIKVAYREPWDLLVAFPPCTDLTSAGAVYWPQKQADGRQKKAIEFVLSLRDAPIEKIAIENPVGILSKIWRKPDQIIHPYHFGTPELKRTCLWLKNLPKLIHTNVIPKPEPKGSCIKSNGRKYNYYYHQAKSAKERSRFWPLIAKAMAEQWVEQS